MKNLKTRKIILTLAIVLAVVLGLTVRSFAEDNGIKEINPSTVVNSPSNGNTNANANANGNSAVNANANKNVAKNVANNTSSYNNTNLPSTGLKDYTPMFVVAGALVIVAIVAYKKAKYYKNI